MNSKRKWMNNFPFQTLTVFGHRGFSAKACENTLPAFELIKKHSIPGVELDLHLCASGEIVICHDFSTGRVFSEDLQIKSTGYSRLKSLKIKDKCNISKSPDGLPLLTEVLDLLGKDVIWDFEIKSRALNNTELMEKTIGLIDQYGLRDQAIISSFNPFCIRTARKMGIRNTALIYSTDKDVYFFLRRGEGRIITKALLVKPDIRDLSRSWNSGILKKTPERILAWTADDPDLAESLYKQGVRGFIANDPKKILERLTLRRNDTTSGMN